MSNPGDNSHGYRVVVNSEEQYSLWPSRRELPDGWRAEGTEGSREDCLARIGAVWQDLRPLSTRTSEARG
ncbi:MbtH family protein [Amycolatopsis sp. PS_44_ISF1]|uniref:MbtH family protein n=1 Tax=Amycolatopsis sp. PS_44_ISF1 TaxID=2974917 RepID=UPI0028DED162|nr:MbtH family protein [Amycolatopsis sp. PS_44_ISF1]MDT8913884.1 MbtH family protein [Amycolatopsis sp. PS_44_ISF1]